MVKAASIRTMLSIAASMDLEVEQLNTAFLHGDLEEEIYTQKPEGFVQKGKENLLYRLKKMD